MPIFDPEDLIGRTLLSPPQENGERLSKCSPIIAIPLEPLSLAVSFTVVIIV